jgi:hypothetical protein
LPALLAEWRLNPVGSDETIFPAGEAGLKRIADITDPDQTTGPIMAIILNAIYRQFLRSSLSGMRKFAAG